MYFFFVNRSVLIFKKYNCNITAKNLQNMRGRRFLERRSNTEQTFGNSIECRRESNKWTSSKIYVTTRSSVEKDSCRLNKTGKFLIPILARGKLFARGPAKKPLFSLSKPIKTRRSAWVVCGRPYNGTKTE